MDMFKILTKFSEIDSQTTQKSQPLNESEKKGVTVHKGKYGTSHKAGDEPHKGDEGGKKDSDTSHLQAFLGKKPDDHDSKKGRVHKMSDEPPKGHEYDDGDEAPKKRGRPKKNLKDWIEALDEMIAEDATAQPTGATAGGTGTTGGARFKVVNNPDGSRQVVDTTTGLGKTYPKGAESQASTEAARMNAQAVKSAQTTQQSTSTSSTQSVTEEELDEKWDQETKVAPSEKGKYEGKTKEELLKMYNALKKSGPHKKGSPEFGKMRELAFAIRAKGSWGKVDEGDAIFGAQPSPFTMANQKPVAEGKKMKKNVKEGTDPHEAARSLGRSHAMSGHPHSCPHGKGTMEAQCYHEGYVHALEECYGSMNEGAMEEDALLPPKGSMFRGKPDSDLTPVEPFKAPAPGTSKAMGRQMPGAGLPMRGSQYDSPLQRGMDKVRGMFKEDDLEESPFSWAAKNTPAGEKFTVGGKTFTKKADEGMYEEGWNEGTDLDKIASDPMLEGWDKQLNQLLNEDNESTISEGLTVTTSTGQQGMPDSVSISASDEDAQKLMQILKMSGLSGGSMSGEMSPTPSVEVDTSCDYEEEDYDAEDTGGMGSLGMPLGKHFSHNVEPEDSEPPKTYAHDEVIDGLDCSDAMKVLTNKLIALESLEMPDGMGMSVKTTDKENAAPEPYDAEEVMKALEKGSPKDSSKKKSSISDKKDKEGVTEGELPMPAGKGMSKNVEPKQPTQKKPLEQEKIVGDLKRAAPKAEKSPFSKKELEESSLPMPDGMGMSTPAKDKEQKLPEPKDYEQVENELAKQGGKEEKEGDSAFAALKRLIQSQMPKQASDLPKADSKQEGSEPSDNDSDDFENMYHDVDGSDHSEHSDHDDEKKMNESSDRCDECGAMYEGEKADHQCESEHLDEWANSLRDGKKSKLKDEQFMTDSKFMTDTLAGGPNRKKPDQTVNPHTKVKVGESRDDLINEWLKLSGIR